MRYYMISLPEEGTDQRVPFVVAECVDEFWATEMLRLVGRHTIVSEDLARLDPELSSAIDAWDRDDDTEHARLEVVVDAEIELDDAKMTALAEGLIEPEEPIETPTLEEAKERGPAHVARYYWGAGDLFERLYDIERREGPEEAAALASRYAAELVSFVRDKGHRVL